MKSLQTRGRAADQGMAFLWATSTATTCAGELGFGAGAGEEEGWLHASGPSRKCQGRRRRNEVTLFGPGTQRNEQQCGAGHHHAEEAHREGIGGIFAHQCSREASGAELSQMIVEVPVTEETPGPAGHGTEESVLRPVDTIALLDETVDQGGEGGQVRLPGRGLSDEGFVRPLGAALGPGNPEHRQVPEDRPPQGPGPGSRVGVPEGMPHLVGQMRQHLGSGHAAPTGRGLGAKSPESLQELPVVDWLHETARCRSPLVQGLLTRRCR